MGLNGAGVGLGWTGSFVGVDGRGRLMIVEGEGGAATVDEDDALVGLVLTVRIATFHAEGRYVVKVWRLGTREGGDRDWAVWEQGRRRGGGKERGSLCRRVARMRCSRIPSKGRVSWSAQERGKRGVRTSSGHSSMAAARPTMTKRARGRERYTVPAWRSVRWRTSVIAITVYPVQHQLEVHHTHARAHDCPGVA